MLVGGISSYQRLPLKASDAVAASWQRCEREYHLPRSISRPIMRLLPSEIIPRSQEFNDQTDGYLGEIDNLIRVAEQSHFCFIMCNREGIALSRFAGHELSPVLDGAGVVEGSCWTEKLAGTNGISMAIAEKRVFTVAGADHYFDCLRGFACSAAPVLNHANVVIGAIDLSGLATNDQSAAPLARRLLESAAAKIQARLFRRHFQHSLIVHVLNDGGQFESSDNALLAIDPSGIIIGATLSVAHLFGKRKSEALLNRPIFELAGFGIDTLVEQVGRTVSVEDNHAIKLLFKPELKTFPRSVSDTKPKLAKVKTNVQKQMGALPIVGASDQVAATALALIHAGLPILLQGEAGTGKTTLARQLLNAANISAAKSTVLSGSLAQCGLLEPEDLKCALDEALANISNDKVFALVFDDVDCFPVAQETLIAHFLDERRGALERKNQNDKRSFPVLLTSRIDANQHPLSTGLAIYLMHNTIQLTPLREHMMLSEVVKTRLGGHVTISEQALTALLAYSWPGNHRELSIVLSSAFAVSDSKLITFDDLPASITNSLSNSGDAQTPEILTVSTRKIANGALRSAIAATNGNVARAARSLGISRATFYRRLSN